MKPTQIANLTEGTIESHCRKRNQRREDHLDTRIAFVLSDILALCELKDYDVDYLLQLAKEMTE